jgi:hypothetical protein
MQMSLSRSGAAVVGLAILATSIVVEATHADPPTLLWRRQIGEGGFEYASALATDAAGNVVVAGLTNGPFAGPNKGGTDIFIAEYAASGTLLGKRKLATSEHEGEADVAIDSQGNVAVASDTEGSIGQSNNGSYDAFLVSYAPDRTIRWRRQVGTRRLDVVRGVATADSGSVVIAGWTEGRLAGTRLGGTDAFVVKYAANGAEQWRHQLGTSGGDEAVAVASDPAGNVVILGTTDGSLGGPNQGTTDAFVVKYAPDGTELWRSQLGTALPDQSVRVVIDDAGNVVVAGNTIGSLGGPNNGDWDVFVAVYAPDGALEWAQQPGSTSFEWLYGLAIDPAGNIVLAYKIHDDSVGEDHPFCAVYSPDGTLLGTQPLPVSPDDPSVFTIDGAGNVLVAGFASADPDGDAFVAKYAPLSP